MSDFDLDISPFASYQMLPTLAATFWADVVQYSYYTNKLSSNALPDMQLGVGWDVTSTINLNPYIGLFPTAMDVDTLFFGMILSAKIL
jgi:hypothetical protein